MDDTIQIICIKLVFMSPESSIFEHFTNLDSKMLIVNEKRLMVPFSNNYILTLSLSQIIA